MAELLARGLRAKNLLDQSITPDARLNPAEVMAAGGSDAARGLRSALSSTAASSLATEALQAEIAGDTARAAQLYGEADVAKQNASVSAPRVTSLRQATGAGDVLDYVSGVAPQALLSTAPVVAGALLGRGIGGRAGAYLGGAAPAYNLEANETIGDLAQDPQARARMTPQEIQNLGRVKGLANTALETVGPGLVVNKLLGRGIAKPSLRTVGRDVGTVALAEGSTEGVQQVVGDAASSFGRTGTPTVDPLNVLDAAVAGAAGGGTLAAPRAAIDLSRAAVNKLAQGGQQAAGAALDAAQPLVDSAKAAGSTILDEIKTRSSQALDAAQSSTLLSETDSVPPEVLSQGQEGVALYLDQQDTQKNQFIKDRITQLAQTGSARAQEILTTLSTPETYGQARDYIAKTTRATLSSKRLKDLADSAASFTKGVVDGPAKKSNEQMTSFQRLALDEMLTMTPPDVAESEGFQAAAPLMINALARLRDDLHPQIRRQAAAEFAQLYGDQAFELAARIGALAARDNPNIDPDFVERDLRKQLADGISRQRSGLEVVKKNLTTDGIVALQEALGTKLDDSHLSTLVDTLSRRAASGDKSSDTQIDTLFGQNRTRIEHFFNALHENDSQSESSSVQAQDSQTDGEVETSDDRDFVERQAAKAAGDPVFIGKKDSPTLFDKAFPKAIEERVAKERLKDPTLDYVVVPAEQGIKEAGLDPATFGDLSGKSVIRGYPTTDNNEATVFTAKDIDGMKTDGQVVRAATGGKKNADDTAFTDGDGVQKLRRKARASDGVIHFETEDGKTVSIPAYQMAHNMRGRLQKSETGETSQLDALSAGVSELLREQFKRAYVLDDTGAEVDLSTPGAYESVRLGKEALGAGRARKADLAKRIVKAKQKEGVDTTAEEQGKQAATALRAELVAEASTIELNIADSWMDELRTEALETRLAGGSTRREAIVQRAAEFIAKHGVPPNIRANLTVEQKLALKADKMLWAKFRAQALRQWPQRSDPTATIPGAGAFFDYMYGDNGLSNLSERARAILSVLPTLERVIEGRRNGEQFDVFGNPENSDTDTSSDFIDPDKLEATKRIEEITDAVKNLEKTTRAQSRPAPRKPSKEATDKLAAMKNLSEQGAGAVATDEQVTEAKAYVEKTLGKDIQLAFEKDLGGISGEWEQGDTTNIIRLALNAGPGVLSVAQHEAMHELFARLTKSGKENVKTVLLNAASSSTVTRALERLLRNEPAALNQIKNDPEERLAYMYQFWAAGELTVGPKTDGVFAKIKAFLRKITGLITDDERALAIITAFHGGQLSETSAAGRVLNEIFARGDKARALGDKLRPVFQKASGLVFPANDILMDSDNPHANEIGKRFFTTLVGGNSTDKWGLIQATRAQSATWTNRFGNIIADLTKEEVDLLRDTLSTGKPSNFAPVDKAAEEIKKILLPEFREYMIGRGVKIGKREDYFPRVWDFEKIAADVEGFGKMLTTNYPEKFPNAEAAMTLTHRMSLIGGVEQEGKLAEDEDAAGFTPFMQAVNKMKLDFIKDEHAQAFLNDDLVEIMTSYLKQGVHRAEYENRMGEGGAGLEALITKTIEWETARALEKSELSAQFKALSAEHGEEKAISALRTDEKLGAQFLEIEKGAKNTAQQLVNSVHAMEGTIGHDKVSPGWRKFSSWIITYQNFRLLPLQLFSSMIDPLGLIVRGGTAAQALDAAKAGFKEVLNTWTGKEMTRDEKTKLAELIGTVEHQTFLSSLGNTHESMYMTRGARKVSAALFKYNGMEGWNRAMRISATTVAVSFIKEHATNSGDHSVRWLEEMGLKAADVKLGANGEVVLFKEGFEVLGMSKEEAAIAAGKMQQAVNQWVDGAMLRPNAALRPAWSSDPRWGLVFYLKQFTYAFQKTFLSRVRNEYMHGNLTPATAMLPFIPTMIAADVLRGLIQNGGELPNYMKGWGPGDYLLHGVQRASLLGIGQLPIDQLNHPTDIVGPVAQQAVDVFTQPVDETLYEATPGLALVK